MIRDVPNDNAKNSFVSRSASLHDLALFRHRKSRLGFGFVSFPGMNNNENAAPFDDRRMQREVTGNMRLACLIFCTKRNG